MSLSLRLATAFVGLVAAVAIVFAAVGLASARSGVSGQLDRFLEDRAEELVAGNRNRPQQDDDDNNRDRNGRGGDSNSKDRSFDADSVVQTLDGFGKPEATTGLILPINDSDIALAGSKSDDTSIRTVQIDQKQLRMITAAIPGGGAVQVARELTESNSAIDVIQGQLTTAIPLVALLAAGIGLLLARRITQPLRALATAVDDVAATGNLSVPIEVSGNDEVGRLAAGFDNLLRSLSRSRQQQHQLVQDAAHELRTPLTSVKANIDLLAIAPNLDEEARTETLQSVQRELRELTRLVDEIVDVATDRFSPQDFEPIDLGAAADEAIDRFQARHRERPVEATIAESPIRGDRDSLVRAIGNLLSNANKYSPPGEPITVTVAATATATAGSPTPGPGTGPGQGASAGAGPGPGAGGPTVTVADRGPGIAPAERERVFDRFYRSDEARALPGSGLGLAIVASVVEAHGGTVTIDDNPDGGAIVGFTLPG